MLRQTKRLQLLLAIFAAVAMFSPSVGFARESPRRIAAADSVISTNLGVDFSSPYRSGELIVRLKSNSVPAAVYARDIAAMSSRKAEFSRGLRPSDNDLALLTTAAPLRGLFVGLQVSNARQLWPGVPSFRLRLPANVNLAAAAATLAADPRIAAVQPNYIYYADSIAATPAAGPEYIPNAAPSVNDPIYPQQWAIQQIKADQAWDITTGSDLTVAVLDTGTSTSHPDLAGKVVGGYNFVANNDKYQDDFGHGTYTAGIIAATANNNTGIAGVCWGCKILALKVLGSDGSGDSSTISPAIRYAADKGVRVINMSLGGHGRDTESEDAINYAWNRGAVIIASSGNKADGKPNYPAGYNRALAVGATARQDAYTGFSSFGPYVDITAPGVGIWSSVWTPSADTYEPANGTSASAPFVSGVAALMFSANPNLSNQQVFDLLLASSDDVGTPGWDEHYGNGRLNALQAVQFAQNPSAHAAKSNLSLSTDRITKGSKLSVSGSGFNAGESIEVYFVYPNGSRQDIAMPNADGNGNLAADVILPSDMPLSDNIEDMAIRAYGTASRRDAFAYIFIQDGPPIGVEPPPSGGTPVPPLPTPAPIAQLPRPDSLNPVTNPNQSGVSFFPQVGHTLRDPFLRYWQANGGLAQFGYPLSEPFTEVSSTDGKSYTVQYFERNRFEYHPENPIGQQVLLGLLGVTLTQGRSFSTVQAFDNTADYVYFPQTQHSLGNQSGFLNYWQRNGGLAVYGYPISEEVIENGFVVQYFERNRFEYHPELPAPYKVSLGLLGSELMRAYGWIK